MQPADLSTVPILDYSLITSSSKESRSLFLSQLRHAVTCLGCLYLTNHPIPPTLLNSVAQYVPKFFDQPQEEKDKLALANSQHFLGYSKLGGELTKGKVDWVEQLAVGSELECRWTEQGEKKEEFWKFWGPSQWPDETLPGSNLVGFRETLLSYISALTDLSYELAKLIAEALGLPPDEFFQMFYNNGEHMHHRVKIMKYPVVAEPQGIGAHYDLPFLSFLLQASPHQGLQVQNISGEWIDILPTPNTFVIIIGKSLDFVTQGLARAACHRVHSPRPLRGVDAATDAQNTPRYSVPFGQYIRQEIKLNEAMKQLTFPEEVLKLKETRGFAAKTEATNFSELADETPGMVHLMGKVKSHPDVAKRFYPALFEKYFPNGLPADVGGTAY